MLAVAAGLALPGCGGQPAGAPAPGAAQPGGEPAGRALRIAVIPKGLAHQFWLTIKAGAEAAAAEGGAQVIWQGPAKETEVEKQINIVQDMIATRVDAIVMAACDEQALIPTVQQAVNAGIPVITIDSGVASDLPASFVATDNVAGASMAADTLADLIGGSGSVGLIPFIKGAATSNMREDGFLEGIAAYPDIRVSATLYCQSDVEKAMSVTQDMLVQDPNMKGIFATNEPAAIGAAQALKAAGRAGEIKLVAFDAAEEEIRGLQDGSIQALIVQNPYRMGYLGVKAALDAIAGNPVEKRIDTGVTVVTMANFNDPEIQKLLFPMAQ
ncbi:MAG: ABC transporter substrate-binding protein [Candidatus Hydrogenedentes bacterium]|nr:ABC transporter substrate-binding protein [Candidatus Hydrogenedentota bacterium]